MSSEKHQKRPFSRPHNNGGAYSSMNSSFSRQRPSSASDEYSSSRPFYHRNYSGSRYEPAAGSNSSSSNVSQQHNSANPNTAAASSSSMNGGGASGSGFRRYDGYNPSYKQSYNSSYYRGGRGGYSRYNSSSSGGYIRSSNSQYNQGRSNSGGSSYNFYDDRRKSSYSYEENQNNSNNSSAYYRGNFQRKPSNSLDVERPERSEKSEKPEKSERSDKSDRSERSESPVDPNSASRKSSLATKTRPSLIPSNFKSEDEEEEETNDNEANGDKVNKEEKNEEEEEGEDQGDDYNIENTKSKEELEKEIEIINQSAIDNDVVMKDIQEEEAKQEKEKQQEQIEEEDDELESSYSPQMNPVDVKPQVIEPAETPKLQETETETETETKEDIDIEPEVEVEDSVEVEIGADSKESQVTEEIISKSMQPLTELNECIFPMKKIEYRIWELKNHKRNEYIEKLPYLLKSPIKNFSDYSFYERNFLIHEQTFKTKLFDSLKVINSRTNEFKKYNLEKYESAKVKWNERCELMNQQLNEIYSNENSNNDNSENNANKSTDTSNNGPEQSDDSFNTQPPPLQSRRSRHGDAVGSEAEFLEILQKLEKEKEKDPLYRAEKVSAKIPELILNPIERNMRLMNLNNLVLDKKEWSKRIFNDPIDNFTQREHELFCEAFMSYPKKFGKISNAMGGLRSPRECVLHYYRTKKTKTDYKQLLALKKKRNSKANKSASRRAKSKGSSSTAASATTVNNNTTTSSTATPTTIEETNETPNEVREDEIRLEDLKPKDAEEYEEFYTDTGRRRRAAAPVFDSLEKDKAHHQQQQQPPPPPSLQEQSQLEPPLQQEQIEEVSKKHPLEESSGSVKEETFKEGSGEVVDGENETSKQQQKIRKKYKVGKKKEEVMNGVGIINEEEEIGKRAITSYWSIKDVQRFAELLKEYGTQWDLISQKLSTKSVTMVRNYFQKNADNHGWRELAESANGSVLERQAAQQFAQQAQRLQTDDGKGVESEPAAAETHKNPPLGFFTLHDNIPSNISNSSTPAPASVPTAAAAVPAVPVVPAAVVPAPAAAATAAPVPPQQDELPPPTLKHELPVMKSFATNAAAGTTTANDTIDEEADLTVDQPQDHSPPAQPFKPGAFSITSLLNPEAAKKQPPPPQPPQAQAPQPIMFNPLDALAAAAEESISR